MTRFILLTFALLSWAFWEMSGGSEFVLETRPGTDRIAAAPAPAPAEPQPAQLPTVTRAASLPLVTPQPAAPAAPAGPAGPQSAGTTQARFLTAPADGGPDDTGAVQWTSAADAVAEAIAIEAAVRTGAAQPQGADDRTAWVNGSLVNMRTGPGTDYNVLTALPRGTEVALVELRDGWARVRLSSGEQGWMAEYLLDGL